MRPSSNKIGKLPVKYIATGYIHTMYFDMHFHFIRESVEQTNIPPDAPRNWESESCYLIPYVSYKYIQVTKTDPGSQSDQALVDQVGQKVEAFASAGSKKTIIKTDINTTLVKGINQQFLEESFRSFSADPIASKRQTRDFPKNLKVIGKTSAKNKRSKPGRRAK